MTLQLTTNSYLQLLERSQLLSDQQMSKVRQVAANDSRLSTTAALSDWLIKKNWITAWQAEKLLQAKHRGFFLGHYKLLYRIARGGMSTVYAAEDKQTGKVCALKVLSLTKSKISSCLPRFYREAELAARLIHPNIVRVFDISSDSDGKDQIHFITMELLHGHDLAELVRVSGPLPCRVAAEYIRQAAIGLAHAHAAGLVHRDIKPGNLFLSEDGTIRLLDLGLAQDFESEENLTREYNERVLGTADYLAPEQAVDSHSADSRADLYGLGCTLFFLLTGQPPFNEGTLAQRIIAHQTKPLPSITVLRNDVPPALVQLLNELVVKDRRKRIQTANEVAERLAALLNDADSIPASQPGDSVDSRVPRSASNTRKTGSTDQRHVSQTESIQASETSTGTEPAGSDLLSPVDTPARYQPEFSLFLAELDRLQKIDHVMPADHRSAESITVGQSPDPGLAAGETPVRTRMTWAHRLIRNDGRQRFMLMQWMIILLTVTLLLGIAYLIKSLP